MNKDDRNKINDLIREAKRKKKTSEEENEKFYWKVKDEEVVSEESVISIEVWNNLDETVVQVRNTYDFKAKLNDYRYGDRTA
ncbi:hypothetical protein E2C01_041572 [Portunus trituberculatus]|uniref:Uncharacterized protein n=1 Tax=Portunus trituberculatus TaxID=210409 RepID=A0A5B7FU28_PORTR|nr:hypothetical protein [Portunus trituberculatus]